VGVRAAVGAEDAAEGNIVSLDVLSAAKKKKIG
jgi:hypothetical protein